MNSSDSVSIQDISRRELRKALERHGVPARSERELLVLCDSVDPDRIGRVHLSDIRDKLERGVSATGVSSSREARQLYTFVSDSPEYMLHVCTVEQPLFFVFFSRSQDKPRSTRQTM